MSSPAGKADDPCAPKPIRKGLDPVSGRTALSRRFSICVCLTSFSIIGLISRKSSICAATKRVGCWPSHTLAWERRRRSHRSYVLLKLEAICLLRKKARPKRLRRNWPPNTRWRAFLMNRPVTSEIEWRYCITEPTHPQYFPHHNTYPPQALILHKFQDLVGMRNLTDDMTTTVVAGAFVLYSIAARAARSYDHLVSLWICSSNHIHLIGWFRFRPSL